MRLTRIAAAFLTVAACQASGAEYATTDQGRKVQLHPNGTWKYVKKSDGPTYRSIQFSDFLVDGSQLVGQLVKISGVGGFNNPSGQARPAGTLYQDTFTIGPSIRILSSNLDRNGLAAVHECPLSCSLEVSGIVEDTQHNTLIIQADAIRVVKKGVATR